MSRAHICSHEVKCPVVWRIVIMMLLVPRGALSISATLYARSAAGSRVRFTGSSVTVRARTTSANSMSFGRNSARSRSGPGKPTRRGRGGCGGTPGGGSSRRAGHEIRARGRRSAFGEDRTASNGAGQLPLGFWDAGDVLLVERSGRGGAGAGGRQGGRRRGDMGKQYQSRRGGGTFSAKVSTSANLLGAPPKWNFKKVDLSLLPRGFQAYTSSNANAGQKKRRGAAPSAAAVEEFSPPSIGQGRRRGAKRSIVYAGLAAYNAHFASLVVMELKHEKEKAYERMTSWTQRELSCGGYALQGLVGARVGRLYREHVVRFSLPPRRGDNKGKGNPLRRPPMPYHRFTAGDVVAITPGNLPPTLSQMDTGAVLDGVVLQRMPHFIDVVVKICPEGLADVTPSGRVVVGGSAATFRLDHFVNGISYDRMLQALQTATAPETLSVCPVVRGLVMDSLFPTLDRIGEIDKAGGVQPGIRNSGLPPGLVAPDAEWSRIALGTSLAQTSSGSSRGNIARIVSGLAVESGLNKRQAQAVRQALESRLTLIQGPPGTGKTKTACSLVQAAVMLREGKGARGGSGKVMATAFSNVAADNLLEGVLRLGLRAVRIGRPATVRPALWDATLDAMIEKHPGVVAARRAVKGGSVGDGESEWAAGGIKEAAPSSSLPAKGSSSPAAAAAARQAFAILEGAQERAAQEILKEVDVVVCSCIGAGNDAFVRAIGGDQESGSSSVRFSTVLIDEATQATEAAALVPIIRGCQQLILVGDQNQLPPTVISPEAEDGGLGTSLFSRLMHAGIKPILLDRQYRMHPAISDFPSGHFYDGQVSSEIRPSDRPTPRGFPWPTETAPVAFVLVNGKGHGDGEGDGEAGEPRGASWRGQLERRGGVETAVQGGSSGGILSSSSTLGTSYCNDREAWAVAAALELVVGGGDVEVEDVGIITPYAAQVRLLQDVVGASRRSAAKARAQAGVEATNTPGPPGADSNGNSREEGVRGGDFYASGGRGTALKAGSKAETVMPEIASVDGYQGREKEVIILSAVRSNRDGRVGFLSDWRRLNVAITRARRGVVVVGDPDTLKRDKHWRAFLRWCEQRGAVMGEAELFAAGEDTGRERLASFPEEKTA